MSSNIEPKKIEPKKIETREIETRDILHCYHCGTDGTDIYPRLQDRMFDVPGEWTFRQCTHCGLLWLKNQPIEDDIAKLYESYYTHEAVQPNEGKIRTAVKMGIMSRDFGYQPEQPYSRLIAALSARIGPLREMAARTIMWQEAKKGGKVLDLGCGAGANLYQLQTMGWQVAGTEPDAKAVASAKRLLNTEEIFQGFLEQAAFDDDSFDALISAHVLEHLVDPLQTLKECRRVMKPGAKLTLATPNIDSLASKKFREFWRGLEIPRHFYLFSAKSLQEMAAKAGFREIQVITPSSVAPSIWQASYLLKHQSSLPGGIPTNITASMQVRGLLFWMWEYLNTLMGKKCGEELILIAKK